MDEAPRDARIFRPFGNAQRDDHIRYTWPHDTDKAMAITIFGNPSTKSINRDSQRSMRGVENPASLPITMPIAPLMPMMVKAIPRRLPAIKNARPHIAAQLDQFRANECC